MDTKDSKAAKLDANFEDYEQLLDFFDKNPECWNKYVHALTKLC
jgi:hypothetical protein